MYRYIQNKISFLNLKNFFIKYHIQILFFIFFFLYLFWGLYLSVYNSRVLDKFDIVFNADCPRVFNDFIFLIVKNNHIKTNLHPLQLILLQPLFAISYALFRSNVLAVFFIQALIGSSCILLGYFSINNFVQSKTIAIFASLVYGFSFSTLIFTAIPETYLFCAFFNLLLLFYISFLYKSDENITIKDITIMSLLTLFAFGIIPNSVIFNLLLIIYIFIIKSKNHVIQNLTKIVIIFILMFVSFSCIQKVAYPTAPVFLKNAYNDIKPYLNPRFSQQMYLVVRGIFVNPFYATKLTIEDTKKIKNMVVFSKKQKPTIYLFSLFFLGIPFIYYLFNFKKYKNNLLIFFLTLIILINIEQLYFWGTIFIFLYSQNFLLYLNTLAAILISGFPKRIAMLFYIPFIIYQCFCNFPALVKIKKIIRTDSLQSSASDIFISLISALISLFALVIFIKIYKKLVKEEIHNLSIKNKFIFWISVYIFIVLISGIFIAMFSGR